ncbi:MAG: molybdate ABC transporter substrate-binding protein [Nitrospirales bacterium]|nr:molybdate ABC transporter substrate-binding protein [Nitrospirales bacterium]
MRILTCAFIFFFHSLLLTAMANEVRVAVASNFLATLNEITKTFERDTGHGVTISSGSSGKLYAQIRHGAPFDVFFSADVERPRRLEAEGLVAQGSRFTYAVGRLTLWSADPNLITKDGKMILSKRRLDYLAMANPKTAPYGAAAKSTLQGLGMWEAWKDRVVQGENIAQTFQFVFSHNAQLGFVARSQVLDPKLKGAGSHWDVPVDLYAPLRQQAVLLVNSQQAKAASAFLDYVKQTKSREIIERFGYGVE